MIDTPQLMQTAARRAAVIHIIVPRNKIQEVMGPGHAELLATLAAQGIAPAGPWFTHHLKMSPDIFDYELGVPVDKPVTAAGRVVAGELPAALVARTIYHGRYEGLSGGWQELEKWIVAQGKKSGPSLWETYLIDPSTNPDPASWQTELSRPLAK